MKVVRNLKSNPTFIIITIWFIITSIGLVFEKFVSGNFGVPLDDVYIHFQFARNIAEGKGFSFNPEQLTPGSTSPFWTTLLASLYVVLKNQIITVKILSSIFHLLTGFSTYTLAYIISKSKKFGIIATILTLITGRMVWAGLSGMEITLFTFLLLAFLITNFLNKSKAIQLFLLGVASTVRPEGYLIFAFYLLSEVLNFIRSFRSNRSLRPIVPLLIGVITYLIIIIPYLIFSFKTTGSFLPNTFHAQSIASSSIIFRIKNALVYLFRYIYLLIIDNPIITLAIPVGISSLLKNIWKKNFYLILLLITIGFPIIASITAPNLRHHGRYIIPFIPLYTIIGLLGIREILHKLKHKYLHIQKSTKILLLTLWTTYLFIMLLSWSYTLGWNVKNINDTQVHLGNWVKENTPEDSVLATNDIGAITYISQREIIDMVGLVSPEVLKATKGKYGQEKEEALWEYLQEQKPDYLIIFPSWYPYISTQEELIEIYRVSLDRYTIIDGEMVVYRFSEK